MFDPAVWKNADFRQSLNDREKLLYFYLFTSHHQTMIGACYLPNTYAVNDLGWEGGEYVTARKKLEDRGLILFDEEYDEVFVNGWFSVNVPTNGKHYLGTRKCFQQISSRIIHDEAMKAMNSELEKRGPPLWLLEFADKGISVKKAEFETEEERDRPF